MKIHPGDHRLTSENVKNNLLFQMSGITQNLNPQLQPRPQTGNSLINYTIVSDILVSQRLSLSPKPFALPVCPSPVPKPFTETADTTVPVTGQQDEEN